MAEIIRPSLPKTLSLAEIKQALKLTNDNLSRLNERLRGWDYTLVHGTELLVESPVPYQVTKAYAVRAVDPTTNLDVTTPTSVLVRQVTPGVLGITVQYAPPLGMVDIRRNALQSFANNTIVPVQFDTQESAPGGTAPAPSGSLSWAIGVPDRIVCAVTGYVLVKANLNFDTSAAGLRVAWLQKNGVNTTRWGEYIFTPAGFVGTGTVAEIPVVADDYLQLAGYQNSGGALNVLNGTESARFQARYVAPDPATTYRCTLCFLD
jgi:hypothetical protein